MDVYPSHYLNSLTRKILFTYTHPCPTTASLISSVPSPVFLYYQCYNLQLLSGSLPPSFQCPSVQYSFIFGALLLLQAIQYVTIAKALSVPFAAYSPEHAGDICFLLQIYQSNQLHALSLFL